jgi:hypothetical protein
VLLTDARLNMRRVLLGENMPHVYVVSAVVPSVL